MNVETQQNQIEINSMRIPSQQIQKFLLEVLNNSSFPGSMVEFVAEVKNMVSTAKTN